MVWGSYEQMGDHFVNFHHLTRAIWKKICECIIEMMYVDG